ncbi:MAG TPA: Lar family restriction alleviation protein [Spirochaetia bacterium]|nr:Lar family restriction alleviation protein [Spirochaetia bacterium]
MTDDLNDLKFCPFCGGKAKLMSSIIANCGYYVTCTSCDATTAYAQTQKGAARAWNRRFNPEAPRS